MSNTAETIKAVNGLLSLTINLLMAAQQAQLMIERARAEGREVSDEELAALQRDGQARTQDVLAKLESLGSSSPS